MNVAEPRHLRASRPGTVRQDAPRFVVLVVAVAAVAAVLGLILTGPLGASALVRFDDDAARWLASHRTPTLDRWSRWGTWMADPVPVAVLLALAMIVSAIVFRSRVAPLLLAVSVGGEKSSYLLATLVVRRPRPDVVALGSSHVTSSFPSGHVGSAVSLYGAVAVLVVAYGASRGRSSARLGWVLTAAVAVIGVVVSLCRTYRGFHFVTDVLVGAAVGVSWVVVAMMMLTLRANVGLDMPDTGEPFIHANHDS